MQVDPGELHWSIWLRFGVSPWMMMPKLLAYTSLSDDQQGRNIIDILLYVEDVLLVKPQTDSPVEGGGAEESIDLLWLRV